MVRAGEKAHLSEICRDCGVVTIGWFHTPPRDMSDWTPGDLERYMNTDYPIGGKHLHRDGTWTIVSQAKLTRDINQIGDFLFSMNAGRLVTVASPAWTRCSSERSLALISSRASFSEDSLRIPTYTSSRSFGSARSNAAP